MRTVWRVLGVIGLVLVLLVGGVLVPIPLLMLHIVEALIQAYIFAVLAMVYIASATSVRTRAEEERKQVDRLKAED